MRGIERTIIYASLIKIQIIERLRFVLATLAYSVYPSRLIYSIKLRKIDVVNFLKATRRGEEGRKGDLNNSDLYSVA